MYLGRWVFDWGLAAWALGSVGFSYDFETQLTYDCLLVSTRCCWMLGSNFAIL